MNKAHSPQRWVSFGFIRNNFTILICITKGPSQRLHHSLYIFCFVCLLTHSFPCERCKFNCMFFIYHGEIKILSHTGASRPHKDYNQILFSAKEEMSLYKYRWMSSPLKNELQMWLRRKLSFAEYFNLQSEKETKALKKDFMYCRIMMKDCGFKTAPPLPNNSKVY